MRVELYSNQEINEGINNEVTICQNDIECLGDFAEVILQFTRAIGYTYVNKVIFVKDNKEEVSTL